MEDTFKPLNIPITEEMVQWNFSKIDTDNSGRISFSEYVAFVKKYNQWSVPSIHSIITLWLSINLINFLFSIFCFFVWFEFLFKLTFILRRSSGLLFSILCQFLSVFLHKHQSIVYLLEKIIPYETLNKIIITVLKIFTENSFLISMKPNIRSICWTPFSLFLKSLLIYPNLKW